MSKPEAFATLLYRLRQVYQQLGHADPLTSEEYTEVARRLPPSALLLFQTMSVADQQHAIRICQHLQMRGCVEQDLFAAALLHDVGKAQGRVPFWTRPIIVLGKRYAPHLLSRLALYPSTFGKQRKYRWRYALGYAWWHADIGAELAAAAGLSERAVLYIRTHHQPDGPAAELHQIDEVS